MPHKAALLIAFYRQVTKFGGQHYLAPFFKVFVVVVPVDVKADGVALNAVVRRVIDRHAVEVLPPDQLPRDGDRDLLIVTHLSHK